VSRFELIRFNYDLLEASAQRTFQADPEAFLAGYDLTPTERALIDERDWMGLVEAGVSTYVLANYGRAVGLSFADLGAAMRGETPEQMEAFLAEQNERVAPFQIVPEEHSNG
jgi:hypothetical protein